MKNLSRCVNRRKQIFTASRADASSAIVEAMESRLLLSSVVYSYVTDQSSYNVGVGQTATVKVYLQETLNGNSSIIDSHGENGLFGAAFEVVSGTRPASPSNITAINANTTDFGSTPATDLNNSAVKNPNEADLSEAISVTANTGVETGNSGAPSDEVYLGSLTITGGSAAGTTTFKLGAYDVGGILGGNTITNPDGYDLDLSGSVNATPYIGASTTSTTFSVVTVGANLPTPTVSITSGNSVYTGIAYKPTAAVTGSKGTDATATLTYTYYAGSAATGTALSTAPSAVGTYTVVAHFAGDSIYAAATSTAKTFEITAGSVITAHAATLQGQEGRLVSGEVATFTDSHTALLANSFSATINWGDGTTSAGTVVRTAAGSFTVSGSHTYSQEKPAGYAVKVSIEGIDGSTGVANSLAKIVDSPLDTPTGLSVDEIVNVAFTDAHLGTFRDQDALNTNPADYSGTINWGDGTSSAAVFALNHSTANVGSYWNVEGSHKYAFKKTYKAIITLHDIDSPTVSLTIDATIVVN